MNTINHDANIDRKKPVIFRLKTRGPNLQFSDLHRVFADGSDKTFHPVAQSNSEVIWEVSVGDLQPADLPIKNPKYVAFSVPMILIAPVPGRLNADIFLEQDGDIVDVCPILMGALTESVDMVRVQVDYRVF